MTDTETDMILELLKEKEPMTVRLATSADMEKWKKDGMIPVACRLCGEVVLYPSKFFKKDELANYECPDCKKWLRLYEIR